LFKFIRTKWKSKDELIVFVSRKDRSSSFIV
jgi:hypothetical protein